MRVDRRRSGRRDAAARALDAIGRGADAGLRLARSLRGPRRPSTPEPVGALSTGNPPAPAPPPAPAANALERPEVSEIEVRDLRADLARELGRLAGGEIVAARGDRRPGAEHATPDEGAAGPPSARGRA